MELLLKSQKQDKNFKSSCYRNTPSRGFEATVCESVTSVLLPFGLRLPCVHFSDLTDQLCIWNTVPQCEILKRNSSMAQAEIKRLRCRGQLSSAPPPFTAQRLQRGAQRAAAFTAVIMGAVSMGPWKSLHLNMGSISLVFVSVYILILSRHKATSLMESRSLSHSKSTGSPLEALSGTLNVW